MMKALLGCEVARLHVLPVNNAPDLLQVFGAHVLVLQVIRMLPDVDTQQRDQPVHVLKWVLVGAGCNLDLACSLIVSEPAPARALRVEGDGR